MTPYTLTPSPSTSAEWLLTLSPDASRDTFGRASRLARAIGCRLGCTKYAFYLTPSRSRKWRTLFDAGFDACRRDSGAWYYLHEPKWPSALELPDAVRMAALVADAARTEVAA